jgi:hypothetical protein
VCIHYKIKNQKQFKKKSKIMSAKNKKSDSKSEKEFEDAWVFDSLVGFLRGPVWHVPVMTFIEQKSLSKLIIIN